MLTILSVATAVVAATGMVWLAVSLRGQTPRSLFLGVVIPLLGMIAWTYQATPMVVWVVQAIIGLVTLVWTFPWWRGAARPLRLGAFWLAVPVWLIGALSPLLLGGFTVAGQRIVYGGFAVLVVLLALAAATDGPKRGPGLPGVGTDISIGIVAGFLLCLALLMLTGATQLFAAEHWTVDGEWGHRMADRFWGGSLLGYHPNFIGLTAVMVAMRVGPDPGFSRVQRLGACAVAGFVLILVESRTSFVVAFVGAGVFALVHLARSGQSWWRPWRWLSGPPARRVAGVALAPLLATTLVFAVAGGTDLLFKNRYAQGEESGSVNGALSGRADIWGEMLADYADGSPVELALGNPDNARGVQLSVTDPDDPDYDTQAKHTADNALIGVLYRSGAVGLACFVLGLVIVVRRVFRTGSPPWAPVAVAALLVGSLTEDEIASTAPAWLLVCGAELATHLAVNSRRHTGRIRPNAPVATSPNG
ncbi:MAG: O-antigen ligase family protein [Stackebrandtia sp.]